MLSEGEEVLLIRRGSETLLSGGTLVFSTDSKNEVIYALVTAKGNDQLGGEESNEGQQANGGEVNQPWVKTLNDLYGQGTFIPGTVLSFVENTKCGRWASMGGLKFSTSPYSVQKSLINEAKWAGKYVKNVGNTLGIIGIGITLYDMGTNGVTTSNSIDLIMGGISFIPGWGWIAGGVYFIGNAALKAGTGKDLGEHIDNW